MADLIREAPLGQLLRYVTGNRVLKYPEELPDFELPETYRTAINNTEKNIGRSQARSELASRRSSIESLPSRSDIEQGERNHALERKETAIDADAAGGVARTKSRLETEPFSDERLEVERQLSLRRTKSTAIAPTKTADGNILVDWYYTDDPANPQNWSNGKRALVSFIICVYTFVVYTGSAIYTSSAEGVMHKFNVSYLDASLPLSLYVLAYGIGPLVFSPLSEIPLIGRSPVYAVTMALFTLLSLPTALVDNFAGLLVLRFLQGFFGSPCLATGAATMQDM
jgi:DHA1 family multidrug resistance protein-like MFS transporter